PWIGDDRGRDLRPRERRLHLVGRPRAHGDRATLGVRLAERVVVDVVEHERVAEVELSFDADLGHTAPGGAEPALPHSWTVSPGSMRSTCDFVSAASASGVPVSSPNVPQWHG